MDELMAMENKKPPIPIDRKAMSPSPIQESLMRRIAIPCPSQ